MQPHSTNRLRRQLAPSLTDRTSASVDTRAGVGIERCLNDPALSKMGSFVGNSELQRVTWRELPIAVAQFVKEAIQGVGDGRGQSDA
jgi:hypothetical protein